MPLATSQPKKRPLAAIMGLSLLCSGCDALLGSELDDGQIEFETRSHPCYPGVEFELRILSQEEEAPSFTLLATPLSQGLKSHYWATPDDTDYYTTRFMVKFLTRRGVPFLEIGSDLRTMQLHHSEVGEPTGLIFESPLLFDDYRDPERLVEAVHSWDLAIDCGV